MSRKTKISRIAKQLLDKGETQLAQEVLELATTPEAGKIPGVPDGTGPRGEGKQKGRRLGPCATE